MKSADKVNNEKLSLTGLESYQDFLRNPKHVGAYGVYIWGFRFVDPKTAETSEFIPYYVGKHRTNIHRRIQEHVVGIREETHRILLKKHLDNPAMYRCQDGKYCAYIHLDEKRGFPKDALPPEERVKLIPHINEYIDNLYITYIPINHLDLSEAEKNRYVDVLERYVQERIGMGRLSCRSGATLPETFRPKIATSKGTKNLFK
jgi:hypothetical protein